MGIRVSAVGSRLVVVVVVRGGLCKYSLVDDARRGAVGKVNVALHGGSSLATRNVTERTSYCPVNQNAKESGCPGTQNEVVEIPTRKNFYGGRMDEEDIERRKHSPIRAR